MSDNSVDISTLREQVAAYRAIKEQIKVLGETADNLALDIKAAIGDNEVGTIDGAAAVTYRPVKRTAFSQKLCRTLHPAVFEECKETTESRTFRLADS